MPPTVLTATQFDALGLADWRYSLGAIQATFRADSFMAAADFVGAVAALADAANHHPAVDLRYPGVARVRLTTHSAAALTTRDVGLAEAVSALAAERGLTSEPATAQALEIAVDALDIDAVRPFWAAVFDYVANAYGDLEDPRGHGPAIWFQQMDAPRPQRNRIHFDITVPHEIAEARVQAAIDAGGHLVSDASARAFWIVADPEGNEVCVCTWQDRQ